jgi:hypothetical protein
MDYRSFTNDSLAMMYEGIRGALVTDDIIEKQFREPPFRVRDTEGWKQHAADLEAEMFRRGMNFDPIDWSEPVMFAAHERHVENTSPRPMPGKPGELQEAITAAFLLG